MYWFPLYSRISLLSPFCHSLQWRETHTSKFLRGAFLTCFVRIEIFHIRFCREIPGDSSSTSISSEWPLVFYLIAIKVQKSGSLSTLRSFSGVMARSNRKMNNITGISIKFWVMYELEFFKNTHVIFFQFFSEILNISL